MPLMKSACSSCREKKGVPEGQGGVGCYMMVGVGVSRKALVHSIKGVAPVSNAPRRHPLLMASALQAVTLGCWIVDRALVLFRTCARRQKCHHHENSKKQEHMHVGMPLKRTAVLGVLIKRGGGGGTTGFKPGAHPLRAPRKRQH